MDRCLVCRAALADDSYHCRRCGCELASVMATESETDALLRTSVVAFAAGEEERAARLATTAAHLWRTPLAGALMNFAQWRRENSIVRPDNDPISSLDEVLAEIDDEDRDVSNSSSYSGEIEPSPEGGIAFEMEMDVNELNQDTLLIEESESNEERNESNQDALLIEESESNGEGIESNQDALLIEESRSNDGIVLPEEIQEKVGMYHGVQGLLRTDFSRLVLEEMPIVNTSLDTLDRDLFAAYYQKLYGTSLAQSDIPLERILENTHFLVHGDDGKKQLSWVGLLAFGKGPQNFIPSARISAVRWLGKDMNDGSRDRQEILGCLSQQIERAEAFILRNTHMSIQINGFRKTDLYQYPQVVLREAIVNAITHRDYSLEDARILLYIFDDRIEIISPGTLPEDVTMDNICDYCAKSRNKILARVLFNFGYTRMLGAGIPMMMHLMRQSSQRPPDFEINNQQFLVRLWAP